MRAALVLALGLVAGAANAASAQDRALIDKYCVACHNERAKAGSLVLEKLDPAGAGDAPEVWEKVVRKLRLAAMPPAGSRRPDRAETMVFVERLEATLDSAATRRAPHAPAAVRRLTRAEYGNAIRDLLALDIDVRSLLPPDDQNHGFDNMADALSLSSTLLERYLAAARRVGQLAVGDAGTKPVLQTYPVPGALIQDDWMGEELPFGSRGGFAVKHWFPMDGEYVIQIRLRRQVYGYVRGLGRPHTIDVRLDGGRIRTLTIGREWEPGAGPPMTYAGETIASPEWEDYWQHADEKLDVRFAAKAGMHSVSVAFSSDGALYEGVLGPHVDMSGFAYSADEMQDGYPALATITVGGPYTSAGLGDTTSRKQIFTCRPQSTRASEQTRCVERILSSLARRAFRRPVGKDDVQELLTFFETASRDEGFEGGIRAALERILSDPEFLFRIERPSPKTGKPAKADAVSLASRLSFFLWSSIPDAELLDLAERGRLNDPAVLERQVRRMLADSRSQRFVDNFLSQWLQVRSIRNVVPDTATFPEFDENLRDAMLQETELFLESQVREDRAIADLLGADYSFLNERLAKHYGVPNVYGPDFRRVTFKNGTRGGLIGQASILTVTSYANRTSPVLRGKWLLDNVLGTPPPPPPPHVPTLTDDRENGRPRSVRERLERHRKNPVCATCHNVIDPLGFALENYDAIGRWRTLNETGTPYETGQPIDASSQLADGTKLTGPDALRRVLLDRREVFIGTVIEKLLTYALGREMLVTDMPYVRQIARGAAASDYRWSSVIVNIVKSPLFQRGSAQS